MIEEVVNNQITPSDQDAISIEEWRKAYDALAKKPLCEGDFLQAQEDKEGKNQLVRLKIEFMSGRQPFISARAYIPNTIGSKLGWYAHAIGSLDNYGWKCILLPKARNEVIAKFGMTKDEVGVRSLRIIRQAKTGKSLLCEIAEWE